MCVCVCVCVCVYVDYIDTEKCIFSVISSLFPFSLFFFSRIPLKYHIHTLSTARLDSFPFMAEMFLLR
jgi:hypothetical protein